MKKLKLLFPAFLAFMIFATISCKKDNGSAPDYVSGIAGGWKYIKGGTNEKYIQIYADRTYSILSSDAQGIHDQNDGILFVTANQLMIDYGNNGESPSVSFYNYTLKGDTLTLSQPSQSIVMARDKAAPDTSVWIKKVSANVSYKAPVSQASDITYDGTSLWYGNGYASNYIYKVNPANGAMDSLNVTEFAWAVEADGSDLWVSNDGYEGIIRINKTTGSTITASVAMGAWIYGIAKDNNFLWCYSNNENKLYKYNTTNNTISTSMAVEGSWEGLAMAGGYLYVASNGKIHKCTTSPLSAIASFELSGYHIFGIAFDGSSFWVSAYQLPSGWPEIIKLNGVN